MMQQDHMIIRCLNCGTKNRIPQSRLQEHPTCGKCHAPLDEMIIRCLHCGTKNRMPENRLKDKPLCGKCGASLVVKGDNDQPVVVTDADFAAEVLAYRGGVLVDCWAPWCGPCRTVAPVLDELAVQYSERVKIAKLNVDENPVTASQYTVRSIPTLLLFRRGELVNRLVGALPKEEIEKSLRAIMDAS
jgi:thioredoxin 2